MNPETEQVPKPKRDPAKVQQWNKTYYQKHKEQHLERVKAYQQTEENKEKKRIANREYMRRKRAEAKANKEEQEASPPNKFLVDALVSIHDERIKELSNNM